MTKTHNGTTRKNPNEGMGPKIGAWVGKRRPLHIMLTSIRMRRTEPFFPTTMKIQFLLSLLLPTGANALFGNLFCGVPILRLFLCNECTWNDPCIEGACSDGFGTYACTCHPGWMGTNCEVECPCLNGGNCIASHTAATYACSCPVNFEGDNCELMST